MFPHIVALYVRHGKNREKIYTIQVNILNYIQCIYKIPKVFDLTTRAVQVICRGLVQWRCFGLFQHNDGVRSNVGSWWCPYEGGGCIISRKKVGNTSMAHNA